MDDGDVSVTHAGDGQDVWRAAVGMAARSRSRRATAPAAAQIFPPLTGRVVDEADILERRTRAALTQKLADLEAKTTDQLVVVDGALAAGHIDRGLRRAVSAAHWQIGQKDKNNGVLLIVAPTDRKVRIEVGYGLEGVLPDAVASFIIQNSILPRFRANDFTGGIGRGVDDIVQVLTGDAAEWKRARRTRAAVVVHAAPCGASSATLSWMPEDFRHHHRAAACSARCCRCCRSSWLRVLLPVLLWIGIALGLGSRERWAALGAPAGRVAFSRHVDSTGAGDHVRLVIVVRLVVVVLELRLLRRRRQLRRRRIVGKLVRRLA